MRFWVFQAQEFTDLRSNRDNLLFRKSETQRLPCRFPSSSKNCSPSFLSEWVWREVSPSYLNHLLLAFYNRSKEKDLRKGTADENTILLQRLARGLSNDGTHSWWLGNCSFDWSGTERWPSCSPSAIIKVLWCVATCEFASPGFCWGKNGKRKRKQNKAKGKKIYDW